MPGGRDGVLPAARGVPEQQQRRGAATAPTHFRRRRAPARARPEVRAGSGFPFAEFREVSSAARYAGRWGGEGGDPERCTRVLGIATLPVSSPDCTGEWRELLWLRAPPPVPGSRLRGARAGLKSPRGARGQPAGPRPCLQIRVACRLPEGSGLGPGDRRQPPAP